MSSTPTKQIDGDVAISRNVRIGGKATVRGSVTVGHNLKIEGWLDAVNIKGPNKGLFKTAAQLREAYPNPHEGWWALVGNTLPAQVYIADGGSWTASKSAEGNPILAGNPTIDSSECVGAIEAVEDMAAELDTVKANVGQNTEDIRDLRSSHTTQGNHINLLQTAIESAQARADKGVADAANAQTTATNARTAADDATTAANAATAEAAEAIAAADAAKAAADDATTAIADFSRRLDENETTTTQLTSRVDTLTGKVVGMSILPFDGVFNPPTDGSVVQYPAGGVWWQPQKGNFLFCSSDLGYVAADYNADGAARPDRIFRHDNILFRYDGSSLVGAGITDEQAEQIRHSTPVEVASEEEMEQLIADGECQAGQIYFLAEEE